MSDSPGALARGYEEEQARRAFGVGQDACREEGERGGRVPPSLSDPAAVTARLEEIERELAEKQNALEDAAMHWYREKRNKERIHAIEFRKARASGECTGADAAAWADECAALIGSEHEAAYEAIKAKVKVLEARASIGQSILRSQREA